MNKKRITIHIVSKDRLLPLYGCLQAIRTQSFQEYDIIILDDNSAINYMQCEHIAYICNRLRIEGHGVKLIRNNIPKGVCGARNKIVELDDFDNEFILRLDDDVLIGINYISKLMRVINSGYDIASGVTPHIGMEDFIRDEDNIGNIINKITNVNDNITIGDECGLQYLNEKILPTPHFRSCALYRKDINILYETNLSFTGFREELFFSLKAILKGLTIGVNTHAIAWHSQALSGGCRTNNYNENVGLDEEKFKQWFKKTINKHVNFLENYYKSVTPEEEQGYEDRRSA